MVDRDFLDRVPWGMLDAAIRPWGPEMEFRTWAALPLVIALTVGGCSSKPEDKAAAPFVDALATLGVEGVTYERAYAEAMGIRLVNARGTLGGKAVAMAEIRGNGFVASEGKWSAGRIQAMGVEGDVSASEIVLVAPKGATGSRAGTGSYDRFGAMGFKGRLMGLPVRASRLDVTRNSAGTGVEIEGLRLDDGFVTDSPILGFAKGVDWRVRCVARSDSREGLVVDISDLNSARGLVTGRLALGGLGTDPAARVTSMDLRTLFGPDAWPEEVTLREARISVALPGPLPAALAAPSPDRYADPYVAALVASLGRMLGGGKVAGEISAMPRAGIPVRSLGAAITAKDASVLLGLNARVPGVPPGPTGMTGPASR